MATVTYVRGAERMLAWARLSPRGLHIRFADDREGIVPLKALRLAAAPVHISLPDPYVLRLRLADGSEEELPWDYLRQFVDEGYVDRSRRAALRGRKALGRRIKRLREAAGLTQAALAERANISRVTLARIEAGAQSPRWETLMALARGLELPLERLLGA